MSIGIKLLNTTLKLLPLCKNEVGILETTLF